MAANEEFPGVSEAALSLAKNHHNNRREQLLSIDPAELPEGYVISPAWDDLEQFGRTALAQQAIPTVMFVYPHIAEGVRANERTQQTVRLFSPELASDLQSLLPDSIPNREAVVAAMLDKVADALTAE